MLGTKLFLYQRNKKTVVGQIRRKTQQIWAGVNPTFLGTIHFLKEFTSLTEQNDSNIVAEELMAEQVHCLRMKGEALMELELSA